MFGSFSNILNGCSATSPGVRQRSRTTKHYTCARLSARETPNTTPVQVRALEPPNTTPVQVRALTEHQTLHLCMFEMMLWLKSGAHLAHRHARNSSHSKTCLSTAACRIKMLLWLEPGAHLQTSIWYISGFLVKCNARRFTYNCGTTVCYILDCSFFRFGTTFVDVSRRP